MAVGAVSFISGIADRIPDIGRLERALGVTLFFSGAVILANDFFTNPNSVRPEQIS
jgi:hypothetical protein